MKLFGGGNRGGSSSNNNNTRNSDHGSSRSGGNVHKTSLQDGLRSAASATGNAGRNPQLSQDLLRQEKDDIKKRGGPILEGLISCLGRILPCSEALIGRLIWVCLWAWKVAPAALYESFRRDYTEPQPEEVQVDPTTGEPQSNTSKSVNNNFGGGLHQYVSKWWQKTFVVPTALGFYFFLWDHVAQPLVATMGCCRSDVVQSLAELGVLAAHFSSGLSLYLCEERSRKKKLQEAEFQRQFSEEMDQRASNNNIPSSLRKTDGILKDSTRDDTREGMVSEKTFRESGSIPVVSGSTTTNTDSKTSSERPKRNFWPFGKKKDVGGTTTTKPLSSSSGLVV